MKTLITSHNPNILTQMHIQKFEQFLGKNKFYLTENDPVLIAAKLFSDRYFDIVNLIKNIDKKNTLEKKFGVLPICPRLDINTVELSNTSCLENLSKSKYGGYPDLRTLFSFTNRKYY